jgi:hypothetical protein
MSNGSISKKKSDALKRHKENEKEEEEGFGKGKIRECLYPKLTCSYSLSYGMLT